MGQKGNIEFEIKIIEGHNSSSYFWFRPVIIENKYKIYGDEVQVLEGEFSIEEGDVSCFLAYFFYKYFDNEYEFNKKRYDRDFENYIHGFEWNLTFNFFSYETVDKMLYEIEEVINLLKYDYNNIHLEPIKKEFSIYYMCDQNEEDYKSGEKENIEKHVDVVIEFYKRFVKRMRTMMCNNPDTNIISIMGP